MELKNVILFILLVLTIIAMSFTDLTGSEAKSAVDASEIPASSTADGAEVVLTSDNS